MMKLAILAALVAPIAADRPLMTQALSTKEVGTCICISRSRLVPVQ